MPRGLHASFQGTAQEFRDSLANEPILVLAALITVYIVLGVLYESYIHPVTILSTLPSAGVGAFLALMLCRMEFDIVALIGIVLLIGIVKKNAIMMIDFALVAEREEKLSPIESIKKACLLRFRPIMMTSFAALLGGLPLALEGGTGSELRKPLGVSIVGGLLISQVLTLYTTPVIYLYMERLGRWVAARRRPGKPGRPRGGSGVSAGDGPRRRGTPMCPRWRAERPGSPSHSSAGRSGPRCSPRRSSSSARRRTPSSRWRRCPRWTCPPSRSTPTSPARARRRCPRPSPPRSSGGWDASPG